MVPNPECDCFDVFSGKAAIWNAWYYPQLDNFYLVAFFQHDVPCYICTCAVYRYQFITHS